MMSFYLVVQGGGGGLRRNWGAFKYFKTWKGGLWKNTERRKKGGFEKIHQFEKKHK
jgi:hypothetical protein